MYAAFRQNAIGPDEIIIIPIVMMLIVMMMTIIALR
jgi:hypothetical protein